MSNPLTEVEVSATSPTVARSRDGEFVYVPDDCPHCHGDGLVTINPEHPDPQGALDVPCVDCGGTGISR
jgi:DnaJ-class molecular chaperone